MNDRTLEAFVKATLPLREHVKEMYLFGSRCRQDDRESGDYEIFSYLDKDTADDAIEGAAEFIAAAKAYLENL